MYLCHVPACLHVLGNMFKRCLTPIVSGVHQEHIVCIFDSCPDLVTAEKLKGPSVYLAYQTSRRRHRQLFLFWAEIKGLARPEASGRCIPPEVKQGREVCQAASCMNPHVLSLFFARASL